MTDLELLCINCLTPIDASAGIAYFFPEDEETDGPTAVCSDCVMRHHWEDQVVVLSLEDSHQHPDA